MKITIFHYHLKQGGVTHVIEQSVKALMEHAPEIDSVELVSGNDENAEKVVEAIKTYLPDRKRDISFVHIPEIGYLESTPHTTTEKIRSLLVKRFSGSLWWVHNYHLGKNPLFTEAIVRTAQTDPEQSIVLHIHDFPECYRFENLFRLYTMIQTPLYVDAPNVAYVTINSRDYSIMRNAGFKESPLHLLHKPLERSQHNTDKPDTACDARADNPEEALNRTHHALSRSPFAYENGAPILLYPVRTIRRKNVLEAVLIATCSEAPLNLFVTLPGVSIQEKPYSDLVESCFKEQLVKGAWGIGEKRNRWNIDYSDAVTVSNAVLSSSVQEGFGYLFINAVMWEKPLFARYLSILNGLNGTTGSAGCSDRTGRTVFHSCSSYFYNAFSVPLKEEQRAALKTEYNVYVQEIEKQLPRSDISLLREQIDRALKEKNIDFSLLSPSLQYRIIKEAQDNVFKNEIRMLNKESYRKLNAFVLQDESSRPDVPSTKGGPPVTLDSLFSFEQFTSASRSIIRSLSTYGTDRTAPGHDSQGDCAEIQSAIRGQFLKKESIRLLYRKLPG